MSRCAEYQSCPSSAFYLKYSQSFLIDISYHIDAKLALSFLFFFMPFFPSNFPLIFQFSPSHGLFKEYGLSFLMRVTCSLCELVSLKTTSLHFCPWHSHYHCIKPYFCILKIISHKSAVCVYGLLCKNTHSCNFFL